VCTHEHRGQKQNQQLAKCLSSLKNAMSQNVLSQCVPCDNERQWAHSLAQIIRACLCDFFTTFNKPSPRRECSAAVRAESMLPPNRAVIKHCFVRTAALTENSEHHWQVWALPDPNTTIRSTKRNRVRFADKKAIVRTRCFAAPATPVLWDRVCGILHARAPNAK